MLYTFIAKDYEDVGVKLWVPGRVTFVTAKALIDFYSKFHETGVFPVEVFAVAPEGAAGAYLQKLRGLDFWSEVEKRNTKK